jgi:hypothetical protein
MKIITDAESTDRNLDAYRTIISFQNTKKYIDIFQLVGTFRATTVGCEQDTALFRTLANTLECHMKILNAF